MIRTWMSTLLVLGGLGALVGACGSDDEPAPAGGGGQAGTGGSPEQTGSVCEVASECYPDIDGGTLQGEAQCLDRVRGGYCTHLCETDDDCCAIPGECVTSFAQVCSPFESTGQKMCFLSCEPGDIQAVDGGAVPQDEQAFCQQGAGADFVCRSSGGGSQNRKVCVPGNCGVGASCAGDVDCAAGLSCVTSLPGGYCTVKDCTTNAGCPQDSACVHHADGSNYCFRTCVGDTACSFCRGGSLAATCSSDVEYVETATAGKVCVPPP